MKGMDIIHRINIDTKHITNKTITTVIFDSIINFLILTQEYFPIDIQREWKGAGRKRESGQRGKETLM